MKLHAKRGLKQLKRFGKIITMDSQMKIHLKLRQKEKNYVNRAMSPPIGLMKYPLEKSWKYGLMIPSN